MVLFGSPSHEHRADHHTTRHTFKKVDYVNVPTYESFPITIQEEGEDKIEIQGLTQKQIQQAILSYVRGMGYSSSDTIQQSGFLSELEDLLPEASKRVQEDLAKQA